MLPVTLTAFFLSHTESCIVRYLYLHILMILYLYIIYLNIMILCIREFLFFSFFFAQIAAFYLFILPYSMNKKKIYIYKKWMQ